MVPFDASVTTWLSTFADSTPAGYKLGGGVADRPVSPQAVERFQAPELTHDQRLEILRRLDPESQEHLRRSVDSGLRDQVLGASPFDTLTHHTGPAFSFNWRAIDASNSDYVPANAWGMSILAKRAYEDLDDPNTFEDLRRAGWEIEVFPAKTTPVVMASKGDQVLIAVRGTEPGNVKDLLRDSEFLPSPAHGGRAHCGFLRCEREVYEQLQTSLERRAADAVSRGEQLRVLGTGHSLGAAVVTLLARRLVEMPGISVNGVYTYGSPRVMDADAAVAYMRSPLGRRTWRFVNNRDFVTEVPPRGKILGYTHVGATLYLTSHGRLTTDLTPDEIARDKRQGGIWTDFMLSGLRARGWQSEGLWDHGAPGYTKLIYINQHVHPTVVDGSVSTIREYLSYGLTDWVVSASDARNSLYLLTSFDPVELRLALKRLGSRACRRLHRNLAPEDRDAHPSLVQAIERQSDSI